MCPEARRPAPTWRLCLWISLAALAQTVIVARAEPGWLRPDLLLAVALSNAFVEPAPRALGFAFAAGMAGDLLSCGPAGLHAVLDMLAAWLIVQTRSIMFAQRMWVQAALGLATAFAASAGALGLLFLSQPQMALAEGLRNALGAAVSTGVLLPLLVHAMGGPGAWRSSMRAALPGRRAS